MKKKADTKRRSRPTTHARIERKSLATLIGEVRSLIDFREQVMEHPKVVGKARFNLAGRIGLFRLT